MTRPQSEPVCWLCQGSRHLHQRGGVWMPCGAGPDCVFGLPSSADPPVTRDCPACVAPLPCDLDPSPSTLPQDHMAAMLVFNDRYFPGWREEELVYYSNALAGETGEFCNAVKKLAGGGTRGNRVSPEDAAGELIDVWIYLGLAWMHMGRTPEQFDEAFRAKMEEITGRMEARLAGRRTR